MKSKNYRNSKLKHQILYEKDKGKKTLYWKLTTEQRKYVEQVLKCKVKPYLYEIRTRTFFNISKLDSILKDIHYAHKKLNKSEKELLDKYGVRNRPIKYELDLTTIIN